MKYVLLRIFVSGLMFFMVPLMSLQETEVVEHEKCCTGCNTCRPKPSAAELLQAIRVVLNNDILLLPQLQPQLIQLLQQIVNEGEIGVIGPTGPAGPSGATGVTGATGAAGGALSFADFFALMPPDNDATVGTGTDVSFPQDGPISGTSITRLTADAFNLADIGFYQVLFQVSVTEPGQLILTLNGAQLAYTVVGRATGTSQIVGMAVVETVVINSILTVRNPAGESTALTITPLAGGVDPVSAHLFITRIQ